MRPARYRLPDPGHHLRSLMLVSAALVSACGSTGPGAPTSTPAAGTPAAAQPTTSQGEGSGLGFDCETLLTAAELDAAAGLQGGIVKTTRRGDEPSTGDVPGVTECGLEIPTVSLWFGHFRVYAGAEALATFDAAWDFSVDQGAGAVTGVGTEALLQSDEMGVNGWARDGSGAAVSIGIAWDEESTTEDAVIAAVRQILTTVLART